MKCGKKLLNNVSGKLLTHQFERIPYNGTGIHQNHDKAFHSQSMGLVISRIFALVAIAFSCCFASSFWFSGGEIVARSLLFEVMEICSPELAISRYFKRFALKSLMLKISIWISLNHLYNMMVQVYSQEHNNTINSELFFRTSTNWKNCICTQIQ